MGKIVENNVFKQFISALAFGLCYWIISEIEKNPLDVKTLLISMVIYFIGMCLFTPLFRKLFRLNKKSY